MSANLKLPSWLANYTQQEKNPNHPAWFCNRKQIAWDNFLNNGFPSYRHERFKYTDFSLLTNTSFTLEKQKTHHEALAALIQKYKLEHTASILLVFVNGSFSKTFSDLAKLPAPLKVFNLDEALNAEPECMEMFFGSIDDAEKYPFATLNDALCHDGLFIYLPHQFELTLPIHLLSVVATNESFMANPQVMVYLNPHSKLTLIEEHISITDKPYFMNLKMTTHIGAEAVYTHYKIQREGKAAIHLAHHFIHQKKDSKVNLVNFSFGGIFSRDDVLIHLEERGASCETNGFYHLKHKNQYIDHHVDILHKAPYSQSEMLYKGIVSNAARAVFNGRLHVYPQAEKVVAHQENHHLLMNDDAESYAKPELEIYADDVKCKHGATTGEIDEEALFYLCSRGILKEKAIEMLLDGFAASVLDRISDLKIRARVQSLEMNR